MLNIYIKY